MIPEAAKVAELLTQSDDYSWDEWHYSGKTPVDVPGLGKVSILETEGGMDEGTSASIVFRIEDSEDGDVGLFRKDGSYASHYGFDWDGDFFRVVAAEKTITVYDRVR